MTQRTRADRIVTFRAPADARPRRPRPGNGFCDYCERFDELGLTRSPAAGGAVLCHSCVSSSRIRAEMAGRRATPSASQVRLDDTAAGETR